MFTIEPGIYFNEALLEAAFANPLQAPYLNGPLLEQYRNFGGVRIEDVVVVTKTGHEVISEGVPKEMNDIEATMQNSI